MDAVGAQSATVTHTREEMTGAFNDVCREEGLNPDAMAMIIIDRGVASKPFKFAELGQLSPMEFAQLVIAAVCFDDELDCNAVGHDAAAEVVARGHKGVMQSIAKSVLAGRDAQLTAEEETAIDRFAAFMEPFVTPLVPPPFPPSEAPPIVEGGRAEAFGYDSGTYWCPVIRKYWQNQYTPHGDLSPTIAPRWFDPTHKWWVNNTTCVVREYPY